MKLFLFSTFLAFSSGALLGQEHCTWGPSYWCDNIDNSKECSSFDHCAQNYWNSMETESFECQICVTVIEKVKDLIEDSSVQSDIENFLRNECKSLLPSGQTEEICETVASYLPEVLQLVSMEITPDAICSLINACEKKGKIAGDKEWLMNLPNVRNIVNDVAASSGAQCEMCEVAFEAVQWMLENEFTVDMAINALDTLCGELGSLSDTCSRLVAEYIPMVWDYAETVTAETFCEVIGACDSGDFTRLNTEGFRALEVFKRFLKSIEHPQALAVGVASGDDECEICKSVVMFVQEYLENNATEAEIVADLEELCALLPSEEQATCKSLVDQYIPAIIDFVEQELDPATVCEFLGFCSTESRSVNVVAEDEENLNTVACSTCKSITATIEGFLALNKTEQEIIATLQLVCKRIPDPSVSSQCSSMVSQYYAVVLTWILEQLDPTAICMLLHFCPSTDLLLLPVSDSIPIAPPPFSL